MPTRTRMSSGEQPFLQQLVPKIGHLKLSDQRQPVPLQEAQLEFLDFQEIRNYPLPRVPGSLNAEPESVPWCKQNTEDSCVHRKSTPSRKSTNRNIFTTWPEVYSDTPQHEQ